MDQDGTLPVCRLEDVKRKQRKEGGKKAGVPAKAKRDLAVSPAALASVPGKAGMYLDVELMHVCITFMTASLGFFPGLLRNAGAGCRPRAQKSLGCCIRVSHLPNLVIPAACNVLVEGVRFQSRRTGVC